MTSIVSGKLIDTKVIVKIYPGLHKGNINKVNAIIVHQTDSDTAQQTFNKYNAKSTTGAHFLIDKKRNITQTALLTQKCAHVGKILSKCYETKVCSKPALSLATSIYHKHGLRFSVRVKNLYNHEKKKSYPDRYPMNEDSIGIEIVGKAKLGTKAGSKVYEKINKDQITSLKWLVNELYIHLNLKDDDVYTHPQVSRKNVTEASTAAW